MERNEETTTTSAGQKNKKPPFNSDDNVNIPPGTDFNDLHEEIEKEILNPFPVDLFPAIFRNLINECQQTLNFPPDYTAIAILVAVSTAVGTTAKVKVKRGWYEFPSLYAAIIGGSGSAKTHPQKLVCDVFLKKDKEAIKKYEKDFNKYEEYQGLGKKEKKDKEANPPVEKPILFKTILHNFTPEILCYRLSDNKRGCTVLSDELATFLDGMNNYSKGDQASTYLSFWSSQSTSIDRVSKPIPLFIQQPFLNILGGFQPRILPKLFPAKKTDNGFIQRFLFAFPDDSEKYPITDNEMREEVLSNFNKFIETYIDDHPLKVDDETGMTDSKLYFLSDEAKHYFYAWQTSNTVEVNKNSETLKGEVISKFDNHFIRLSLILQIMEDCNTNQIGLKAVESAAQLCKYFLHTANKVLDILNASPLPKDSLPENKLNFLDALPNEFTTAYANEIGIRFGMNEKFVQRFISDTLLFDWVAQGKYRKKTK